MTVAERFAENLLILRRRASLSQEQLGFCAGLHRTEVGSLERGTRMPRLDTIIKLAGALEQPPERLMKGLAWSPGGVKGGRLRVTPAERSDLGLGDA